MSLLTRLSRHARIGLGLFMAAVFLSLLPAQESTQKSSSGGDPAPGGDSSGSTLSAPDSTASRFGKTVFLSGNVVRDDGTPPPFETEIEFKCRGEVAAHATITTSGRFSFEPVAGKGLAPPFVDASRRYEPGSAMGVGLVEAAMSPILMAPSMAQGPQGFLGCELRARVTGYRSTALRLDHEPAPGMNEVGTIVIYRPEKVRETSVSATSLRVPKKARKLLERAGKAIRKNELEDAETLLKAAVEIDPKYAEAWTALGQLCERQKPAEECTSPYYRAIEADGSYATPYLRLATIASVQRKWREAVVLSDRLLALDPVTLLEVYYIEALAHLNLNELDLAEQMAREGHRRDLSSRYPQFHLLLANVLARKLDREGSAKESKDYMKEVPAASVAGRTK